MIGKMNKASLVLLGALTLPTAMYGEIIPPYRRTSERATARWQDFRFCRG